MCSKTILGLDGDEIARLYDTGVVTDAPRGAGSVSALDLDVDAPGRGSRPDRLGLPRTGGSRTMSDATYDVVVIGMGAAGLSAAVSYLEIGRRSREGVPRVAVLERAPEDGRGGATRWTGSWFRIMEDHRLDPEFLAPDGALSGRPCRPRVLQRARGRDSEVAEIPRGARGRDSLRLACRSRRAARILASVPRSAAGRRLSTRSPRSSTRRLVPRSSTRRRPFGSRSRARGASTALSFEARTVFCARSSRMRS